MARSEHDLRLALMRNESAPYFERRDAALALAPLLRDRLLNDLQALFSASESRLRHGAIAALKFLGDAGKPLLHRGLKDPDPRVREEAGGIWLERYGTSDPAPLAALANDPHWLVRRHADRLRKDQAEADGSMDPTGRYGRPPAERVFVDREPAAKLRERPERPAQPSRHQQVQRNVRAPHASPAFRAPAPPKPRPAPPPPKSSAAAPALDLGRGRRRDEDDEFEQIGRVQGKRGRGTRVKVEAVEPRPKAKAGGCGAAISSGCAVFFWLIIAYVVLGSIMEF
jgi:hypothetical protein